MPRRPVPQADPDPAPDPSLIATGRDTVAALLDKSGRTADHTPIRRSFVQPRERDLQEAGGPLAKLVRRRDRRALQLYLLVLTLATKEPWDVKRHSQVWARALNLGGSSSSREAVSKAWRRLKELNLIESGRSRRLSVVTILREDGSGEPYEYPDPTREEDRYLRLPFAFWLDDWYNTLELPALAMLLVLLAEKDDVVLPIDRVPKWYGISRATAQRGLEELREKGLAEIRVEQRREPLSPLGYTFERHYRAAGPFARSSRPAPGSTEATVTALAPTAAARRRSRRRTARTSGPAAASGAS